MNNALESGGIIFKSQPRDGHTETVHHFPQPLQGKYQVSS